jgi:hypothetical protein
MWKGVDRLWAIGARLDAGKSEHARDTHRVFFAHGPSKCPATRAPNRTMYGLSLVGTLDWGQYARHPMTAGPPFDENNPMRRDCSKCGKRLTTNAWRTELDWERNPEPVFMFLCLILLALLTSARARGSPKDSDGSAALAVTPGSHPCPQRA